MGVGVGGTGVGVGGTGVGGTGVGVGGMGVGSAVGSCASGTGVAVGGAGVGSLRVAIDTCEQAESSIPPTMSSNSSIGRIERFIVSPLLRE